MPETVMLTPPQALLTRYKEVTGLATDYAVAKRLGVTPQAVAAWQHGGGMTPDVALQIAEELGMPPLQAIAAVRVHAAKSANERARWEKYCARVLVAALVALGAVTYFSEARHTIPTLATVAELTTYTLCALACWFIAAIQTAFRAARSQRLRPQSLATHRTA